MPFSGCGGIEKDMPTSGSLMSKAYPAQKLYLLAFSFLNIYISPRIVQWSHRILLVNVPVVTAVLNFES